MIDPPQKATDKQLEILLLKTESERFRIGEELNFFGRKVIENSISQDHPGIPDLDLRIEVFKRCYSAFFSPEELDRIVHSMKVFLTSGTI